MTRILFLSLVLSASAPLALRAKEAPVPVRTVTPEYPAEMRRTGASGLVIINCLVDERGAVSDPKVEKSSNAVFERPALDAVQKWKFKPATENGSAVPTRINIPIKFICEE